MSVVIDADWIGRWSPSQTWADYVAPEARALWANRRDIRAWARVAMVLGDSRAPALCFVVARHALDLCAPDDPHRGRLSGHAALAAMDLGFATHVDGQTKVDHEAERRVIEETFAGSVDLEEWAFVALSVLAHKLGLVVGPDAPSLADYRDPNRWTLTRVNERDTLPD